MRRLEEHVRSSCRVLSIFLCCVVVRSLLYLVTLVCINEQESRSSESVALGILHREWRIRFLKSVCRNCSRSTFSISSRSTSSLSSSIGLTSRWSFHWLLHLHHLLHRAMTPRGCLHLTSSSGIHVNSTQVSNRVHLLVEYLIEYFVEDMH